MVVRQFPSFVIAAFIAATHRADTGAAKFALPWVPATSAGMTKFLPVKGTNRMRAVVIRLGRFMGAPQAKSPRPASAGRGRDPSRQRWGGEGLTVVLLTLWLRSGSVEP